jgi:hypothetical protein
MEGMATVLMDKGADIHVQDKVIYKICYSSNVPLVVLFPYIL